jgi:hypothetical protein
MVFSFPSYLWSVRDDTPHKKKKRKDIITFQDVGRRDYGIVGTGGSNH